MTRMTIVEVMFCVWLLSGCSPNPHRQLQMSTGEHFRDEKNFPCPNIPECRWTATEEPVLIAPDAMPDDLRRHLSESELAAIQNGSTKAYRISGWLCRRGCVSDVRPDTELGCHGPNSDVVVTLLPGGPFVVAEIRAHFDETKPNYTVIRADGDEIIARFRTGRVLRVIPESFEIAWNPNMANCFLFLEYNGPGDKCGWWSGGNPPLRHFNQPFYTTRAEYVSKPQGPRVLISNPEYTHRVLMYGDGPNSRDDLNTGFYIHFKSVYALVN